VIKVGRFAWRNENVLILKGSVKEKLKGE